MRNIITPAVLSTMIPQEFEDWRDGGEDLRRELTHAAMRDLTCPAGWDMNGEYRSEFGGFFPGADPFHAIPRQFQPGGMQSRGYQPVLDGGLYSGQRSPVLCYPHAASLVAGGYHAYTQPGGSP